MNPGIKVDVTVGTLAALTPEQFVALRDNVLAEGKWETAEGLRLTGGGDYLGVEPQVMKDRPHGLGRSLGPVMFIGIERDGYTHS